MPTNTRERETAKTLLALPPKSQRTRSMVWLMSQNGRVVFADHGRIIFVGT
jgi:hypothetical protein